MADVHEILRGMKSLLATELEPVRSLVAELKNEVTSIKTTLKDEVVAEVKSIMEEKYQEFDRRVAELEKKTDEWNGEGGDAWFEEADDGEEAGGSPVSKRPRHGLIDIGSNRGGSSRHVDGALLLSDVSRGGPVSPTANLAEGIS